MAIKIKLPHLFAINTDIGGNPVQQIGQPGYSIEADVANYTSPKIAGKLLIPKEANEEKILLVQKNNHITDSYAKLILIAQKQVNAENSILDLSAHLWLKHPLLKETNVNYGDVVSGVLSSWESGFSFIRHDEEKGVNGLREPQVGAYHAI